MTEQQQLALAASIIKEFFRARSDGRERFPSRSLHPVAKRFLDHFEQTSGTKVADLSFEACDAIRALVVRCLVCTEITGSIYPRCRCEREAQ